MTRSNYKSAWIKTCDGSAQTFWGEEKVWSSLSSTSVKMISMTSKNRTSFKFNTMKDEMFVCVTGKVKAFFGDEPIIASSRGDLQDYILKPGDAIFIQSSCPYRLEALVDSTLIEVSSGRGGEIVRLHDDYGRDVTYFNKFIEDLNSKWWG